ncbi:PAS domain S-box protein [Candidatus Poribacteria bacterium]
MVDEDKTREQLIDELTELRQQTAELGALRESESRVSMAAQEIAERKRAQEELRKQQEEQEIILDSVPAMIFYKDKEDRFVRVNEGLSTAMNIPKEEIVGKTAAELSPTPDKDYHEDDKAVIASGEPMRNIIEPFETPEGTRWVQTDKIPYRNREGNVIGIIGFALDITERKKAAEEASYEQELMQTLLSSIPDYVYFKDRNRRFVRASNAFCDLFGRSMEDIIGKTDEELFPKEIAEETSNEDQHVIETGTTIVNKLEGGRPIGEGVPWVSTTKMPWYDKEGNIIGLFGISRDITKLKQAEQKYQNLFEAAGDAIFVVQVTNEGPRFVECNPRVLDMFGCKLEDIIGRSPADLSPPEQPDGRSSAERVAEFGRAAMAGEPQFFEWANCRLDGTLFTAEVTINRVDIGSDVYLLAMVRDITERKRMEEALRESEEKYRAVVENGNETILVAQDGMVKFANPKATEITGYSQEELTSRPFMEFIHPDDREMVVERYSRRLKGEDVPETYSFRLVSKSGGIKWVELNTALIDWEGRPATLNFLSDITERKRMEEELLKIAKLESIGVLAGGIAHDLNNLLTGVLGNISLARLYENPSEKDRMLGEAERASMRIKDLTQQLLTFSKGGAPILQTANIAELLKNSADFTLSGSNVSCEFSVPDDLLAADIDEGQMNQVINNLVINSQQAMPAGGVVKIHAENIVIDAGSGLPLGPGAYIKISVEDEGTGIAEEHFQRIFDPFFTTKQAGSGLGLATSYSIVEKHNGHITVESQVGVGTTFHIYLPASAEKVLAKSEEEEEKPIMGAGRVLVMDDEKHVRDLADQILDSLGYKAITVIDGAEAIDSYQKAMESGNPFDAVIMDLTIPGGMGGEEANQRLIEIDPGVKAIVSSGYSNDPVLANFREYGFRGVIAKPYKVRELSAVLHGVITGGQEMPQEHV